MSFHSSVRNSSSFDEKGEAIRGAFQGEECLVLSCGPSLSNASEDKIKQLAKGKKVACIKQAQIKYSDITDFHFLNDNNILKYKRKEDTLVFASSGFLEERDYHIFSGTQPDLYFKVDVSSGTTASDCNFEDFNFSPTRRWGPGIMYETVLPSLLHMGFKTLYVVGWDYTTAKDGTLKHFYNEDEAKKVLKNTGHKIGQMFDGEKEQLIASTDGLEDFLRDEGVKVYLVSEVSELSKKIERMSL